jgi:ParB/RepB/Spo0J family partition protein
MRGQRVTTVEQNVTHVQLTDLVANPENPRESLGELEELAASIVALGVLQPLLVVPQPDGRFMVVDGHRRHAAMRSVGYGGEIPVVVASMDREARLVAAVAAGSFARPLSPIEEAKAFQQLVEMGLTQVQISERTGVAQPRVSTRLKLLLLDEEQQAAVHEGRMTLHQAKLAGYRIKRRAPDKAPRPGRARQSMATCPTCGGPIHSAGGQGPQIMVLLCLDCRAQFPPERAAILDKHCLTAHGRRATRDERMPVDLTKASR